MKKALKFIYQKLIDPAAENLSNQIEIMIERYRERKKIKFMNRVIKDAERSAASTRQTHYVLLDGNGLPYAVTRRQLDYLQKTTGLYKHKGRFTIADLLKDAVYIARGTNSGGGKKVV